MSSNRTEQFIDINRYLLFNKKGILNRIGMLRRWRA